MSKVEVNSKGIKNRLKSVKPYRAIAEYIWNGFDAGANAIDIVYELNDLGDIKNLSIEDNGKGIPFEQLDNKFKPVLSSEKRENDLQHTLIHGKNGLGRLTFYHFSQCVEWHTCYRLDGKLFEYIITADESSIDQYSSSTQVESKREYAGTKVVFHNVFELSDFYVEHTLVSYLAKEFSWFLELMKDWGCSININGNSLPYEYLIKDKDLFKINVDGKVFEVQYFRWANKLNRHFSRYYCIDVKGNFKYSKPTTLNNKGDDFYHSVFFLNP